MERPLNRLGVKSKVRLLNSPTPGDLAAPLSHFAAKMEDTAGFNG